MEDLNQLFHLAAEGDQNAFERIVKATENTVYTYALSLVKNSEDAMDVSQNAYVKLWHTLPTFRGECAPMTWLYRILRSAALDYLRHNSPRDGKTDPLEKPDGTPLDLCDESPDGNPADAYERKERILLVRQALEDLPVKERDLIVLRDMNGLSYEEIANITFLPLGTVKSRLCRARNALKRILEKRNFFKI